MVSRVRPRSLEEFELLAGVREAVDRLKDADFVLVVVTNQPDIARGTQSASTVDAMNAVVQRELGVDAISCAHMTTPITVRAENRSRGYCMKLPSGSTSTWSEVLWSAIDGGTWRLGARPDVERSRSGR